MPSYDEPLDDGRGDVTDPDSTDPDSTDPDSTDPDSADPPESPAPRDALGDICDASLSAGYLPVATGTSHKSVFPPIDDYAFLSDCETSCLIARNGAVEWLCLPRPDSPSMFGAMLDRSAGHFRIGPYGVNVPAARRYLPGGMIVETTWQTGTGWLIVRDALVLGPWHNTDKRSRTYRRTPRDWDAEHILLRTVKCVSGVAELEMNCEPAFDYHRAGAQWEYTGQVYEQATATSTDPRANTPALTLTTDLRLGLEGRSARARTRMQEGDQAFVALSWSVLPPPRTFDEAAQKMWATTEYWRQWITLGRFPDHPWRGYLQRSALTLKGLTYAPTGALLAGATTSLPETPGGERNWDYRYSWVRDSAFALWGLYTLGLNREADDFFAFLYDAATGAEGETVPLQVLYGIGGERELTEYELPNLHGYDGARPVRVGNDAYCQEQHDIWGVILDSVYLHVKSRQQVPESLWPMLQQQVQAAIEHWREPDRGIWEIRGEPQHFTSSKVMCWVALDRGAKLAELHGEFDYAKKWYEIADEIRADILDNGVTAAGVFTQAYGTDTLDAALLMVPLVRFLPSDDHRVRATVLAIADDLTEDGLVLRYRTETTDDGLSGKEGTFTICSFWLVSALVEIGELRRARHLCERLLGYASPLKLYAEEIDTRTGRHLGNFPQAFTHLAQINAVMHVIRAENSITAGEFHPAHRMG
jgi:GH15 family glucan-1,4-alpha-glucosidase